MSNAFYASRLSENIRQTPEGYLICHNVPISRTGAQEYFGEECGLEEFFGQKISVIRQEEDVFDPASLASFEGMPVTDEHPGENVTAGNVREYITGTVRNVRRGEGEDSNKVLADLIIYDENLVAEIQGGKREISCGYSCSYELTPEGTVYQRTIRGNHVAVVPAGRAGSTVAIRDNAPPKSVIKSERSYKKMNEATTKKHGPLFRKLAPIFPFLVKDADPEELAEALGTIEEAISEPAAPVDETPTPAAADEPAPTEQIPEWAQAIIAQLSQLQERLNAQNDEDPVQKLEDELAGGEAEVEKPAEQIDEEATTDEGEQATGDEDIDPAQDEEAAAAVNDSLLKLVRSMKPLIAGVKNEKARKQATDALVRTVNGLRRQPAKRGTKGYTGILDARIAKGRQQATGQNAPLDLKKQQELYDSLNPHKKERR